MTTLIQDVQNLSVAEKAELYNLLQTDIEVNDFLRKQENNTILFEEISRRDAAFERGEMKLTTIEELEASLNEEDNAL